ncbi:hypothetical protein LAZ67_3004148 [Cordylochernes scorpioides]|uniref:DUF4219 domain-containing protein n=1 Tax=Cordylochernes scorpioides TaxID=51811 RepID=A0ABY6K9L5_9ARAC|nr:hypothetical protein LAZ67_3004148 [Cordylochernes scorpioides]
MLSRNIVYHQDNAPSLRSLQAMAAIYDSGFELLPHAPYLQDLAPSDFHLFPHLKKSISGIHLSYERKLKVLIFLEVLVFTLLDCRLGKNWFLTGYGPNSTLPLRRRKNLEVKAKQEKSMAEELRIPKLDGNNYYSWAIRTRSILIQKDIWDAIEPGFPSETSEKQKRKDNLAFSIILLAVEDSFLDDIGDCKRAIDAWQILEDIHTKYGLLHILQLLREFFNIVKRNYENMKEYFARIMKCHRKLAKCHHGFEDGELALILLLGLPKGYEPLILSLEQQEEKLSTSMVKSKLPLEEKRQNQRKIPQEDPNSAFAVRRKEDTCKSPCQERNKFEYDQPRNYHNTWTEGK